MASRPFRHVRLPPAKYVKVTITSRSVDPRTGEPFRWSCIVSEEDAESLCQRWRRKGLSATVVK
jgi:hypothetical protein